jgi:ADP-ribosylglycohydrolase
VNVSKSSILFKKVYGCLIGGAIGDALGGPVEGMHYEFIRRLYNGRVTDLMPYNRPDDFHQAGPDSGAYARSAQAGAYTDDTYLRHFITDAIIAKQGRVSADDLANVWMDRMDIRYFWHSITNSWTRIALTRTPVREAGAGNIPDNSSAMCIGPIGVVNAGDPEQAALDAYEIASLSHDGYSREAACVVASAVAEAMRPEATVGSIVKASVEFLPNRETSPIYGAVLRALELADEAADTEELTAMFYDNMLVRWVRRATHGPDTDPDDERHSPSVDPLESVPCVIAMFYKTGGDYRDGVIAAANFGRDCDTIACMVGYIAGALHGTDAIPEGWIRTVNEANPVPDQEKVAVGLTRALLTEKRRAQERAALISALEETV